MHGKRSPTDGDAVELESWRLPVLALGMVMVPVPPSAPTTREEQMRTIRDVGAGTHITPAPAGTHGLGTRAERADLRERAEQAEAQLASTREVLRELVEAVGDCFDPEPWTVTPFDAERIRTALTTARRHLEGNGSDQTT